MWPFSRPGYRILILCSANVCRSPMAAALLRYHLKALDAARRVAVDSGGLEVGVPGAPVDPRVVALARERGLKLRAHRAQAVSEALLGRADQVLAMEQSHLDTLGRNFPDWPGPAELLDPAGNDVSDPYFGSKADVRRTFERIDELCAEHAYRLKDRGRGN